MGDIAENVFHPRRWIPWLPKAMTTAKLRATDVGRASLNGAAASLCNSFCAEGARAVSNSRTTMNAQLSGLSRIAHIHAVIVVSASPRRIPLGTQDLSV